MSITHILINEYPVLVPPTLARMFCDADMAGILQQIHLWIRNPKVGKLWNDRRYVRNSMSQWNEQFSWMSQRTLERKIAKLCSLGVVLSTDRLNYKSTDRTLWYTIDYDALDTMVGVFLEVSESDKMADWKPSKWRTLINITPNQNSKGETPNEFGVEDYVIVGDKGREGGDQSAETIIAELGYPVTPKPKPVKTPRKNIQVEYGDADDPWGDAGVLEGIKRPKWATPQSENEQRFLSACSHTAGGRKFWSKEERPIASKLRVQLKGMASLKAFVGKAEKPEIAEEWFEAILAWAIKVGTIKPKGLFNALNNSEKRAEFYSRWYDTNGKVVIEVTFDEDTGGVYL